MPLRANVNYRGYTVLVSDMEDYFVLNIFDGDEDKPLREPPRPVLGGGVEGAIDEAKRFIDEYEARK
ncbi:hypothetical protein [Bradyrhizobium sp. TM102]|uniref:hypothetical protein n=1 Tax=Bradyrhizobium sp. TM102 TaxID=2599819 RepID=UPI0012605EB9|nr:hypothetical protein [Bradyrhizobium sp. TM102]BBO09237.1 hypothetical protein TM102_07070 [Bradyrhizobium sp. TM102]